MTFTSGTSTVTCAALVSANGHGPLPAAQVTSQGRLIETRHLHIREHYINGIVLHDREGVHAVGGLPHGIPFIRQETGKQVPDGGIIIDH
jgi:hypothetical protein